MQLRIFTEPQFGADYDTLVAVARTAEELGFDAFFRSDHYMSFGTDGLPGPSDAWITLAGLARDTTRIRLGTLVSPATFRLPGPLAISVANVDDMSGGRVELGLGAGWYEAEHDAYAIPFPSTRERFDRLEDQLAIVSGLWNAPPGERFSYEGRYHSVTNSPALPKPVQAGGPPIVIGGGGHKRTPRLAARYAAEFNLPFAPVEAFSEASDRVRVACEAIDRDPATMTFSTAQVLCCGADEAEVQRRAANLGGPFADVRNAGLAGTPTEVVDKIGTFAAAGATRVYLQVLDLHDLDHLRLVAAEVLTKV